MGLVFSIIITIAVVVACVFLGLWYFEEREDRRRGPGGGLQVREDVARRLARDAERTQREQALANSRPYGGEHSVYSDEN